MSGLTTGALLVHLNAMKDSANYPLSALTPELVIASAAFTPIPDIFDRLIVAEAASRGVPLLTADPIIHASGLVTTIWH